MIVFRMTPFFVFFYRLFPSDCHASRRTYCSL